jgi:restriction endonuclease Mrr
LINGYDLAELMIKYNLGVSDGTPYIVKEIDNDFFDYI